MARPTPPNSETLQQLMPSGSFGTLNKFEGVARFEQDDQDVVINVMEIRAGIKIYGVQIYFENLGGPSLEVGYEIHSPPSGNPIFISDEFCSSPASGYGYRAYLKKPITFSDHVYITVKAVGTISVPLAEVRVVVEYEDRRG